MDPTTLFIFALPSLIFLAFISFALRLIWVIVGVVFIVQRFNKSMIEQKQLLAQAALANESGQAAFVKANQESGQALAGMNAMQRHQNMIELANMLSQLARSQNGGRWSNGAYFENGNAILPGGPSMIDGKLFVPGLRV